jgi:hypothetical protein
MKYIVKIVKISNNISFEIMIQKKDDRDEYIDSLKNESIKKEVNQFDKSKYFQIDLKKSFFLSFEMISKSNQTKFNLNTVDMIYSSTEREIFELFVERDNVQKAMNERNNIKKTLRIENDSQFLIKFRKRKNSTIISIDVVAMNIRFRKNVYAIALIIRLVVE